MDRAKVKERIKNLSRKIEDSASPEELNQQLQDFVIWLSGYIEGLDEQETYKISYTFDKDEIKKESK